MQTPDNDYIDMQEALERLRGNRSILKKMLDILPRNLPLEQLRSEQQSGNIEALTRTVHTIKGVAANLSLSRAHRQAIMVESLLRQGQLPGEELENLAETLQATICRAQEVAAELE